MAVPADPPLVDRRLFLGIVVVLGVQWAVCFGAGILWFGAGGTLTDYLGTIFFGIMLSVPMALVAFIIGLGPGVALWTALMTVLRHMGLSERAAAMISAPAVALAVSLACLFGLTYMAGQDLRITQRLLIEAIVISFPAMGAATIYALIAWRNVASNKDLVA
jgi:hypothetical protein